MGNSLQRFCSVLFSPSGNTARSLHWTETTSTSTLQRGAEPLQGHTWLPARSQGEPKLPLDTGLAPWLLPWFYQSLFICQICLCYLEGSSQASSPLHEPSSVGAACSHPQHSSMSLGTPSCMFIS